MPGRSAAPNPLMLRASSVRSSSIRHPEGAPRELQGPAGSAPRSRYVRRYPCGIGLVVARVRPPPRRLTNRAAPLLELGSGHDRFPGPVRGIFCSCPDPGRGAIVFVAGPPRSSGRLPTSRRPPATASLCANARLAGARPARVPAREIANEHGERMPMMPARDHLHLPAALVRPTSDKARPRSRQSLARGAAVGEGRH